LIALTEIIMWRAASSGRSIKEGGANMSTQLGSMSWVCHRKSGKRKSGGGLFWNCVRMDALYTSVSGHLVSWSGCTPGFILPIRRRCIPLSQKVFDILNTSLPATEGGSFPASLSVEGVSSTFRGGLGPITLVLFLVIPLVSTRVVLMKRYPSGKRDDILPSYPSPPAPRKA
jgi:hypothetical protein